MAFIELTKINGGLLNVNVTSIDMIEEVKGKSNGTIIRIASDIYNVQESYKEVNQKIESTRFIKRSFSKNSNIEENWDGFITFIFDLLKNQEAFISSLQMDILKKAALAIDIKGQHEYKNILDHYKEEVIKVIDQQDRPELYVGLKTAILEYLEKSTVLSQENNAKR